MGQAKPVPIVIVTELFKAGETLASLAEDCGRDRPEIREAIRCELDLETRAWTRWFRLRA